MNEPRFSIIIPTYNYASYLPRAVDSVLAQPGGDYEVVVVDDGSTDETPKLMQRFGSPVCSLRQENQGPSAARNHGIGASHGEWLLFLDSDDVLLPTALPAFRAAIDRHPAADVLAGGFVSVSTTGRRKPRHAPDLSSRSEVNFKNYLDKRIMVGSHGTFMVRRTALGDLRYPEHIRNYEHIVFVAWLLANCRWHSFPDPVAEIFAHPNQLRDEEPDTVGSEVADTLFDSHRLPAPLLSLRERFLAHHLLSRFRACYRRGQYHEANQYYRRAIWAHPKNLAKISYLTKYLRSRFLKQALTSSAK